VSAGLAPSLATSLERLGHRLKELDEALADPVVAADNLAAGFSSAAFVAFLSSLTNVSFTAVQYAIFSSLMTLLPKTLGGYSGGMVDALGYPGFFLLTAVIGLPVLLLVVVDAACGDPDIDLHERIVSAGCAVQNLLLMATARGWGSGLTSGKAMKSAALRALLDLGPQEHVLCCLSVGSVSARKPTPPRPGVHDIVRTLTDAGPIDGLHTDTP